MHGSVLRCDTGYVLGKLFDRQPSQANHFRYQWHFYWLLICIFLYHLAHFNTYIKNEKLQPRLHSSHFLLRLISKYFPQNFSRLSKSKDVSVCYVWQHVSTYRVLRYRINKPDAAGEILDSGDVLLHMFFHLICRNRFRRDNIGSRGFSTVSIRASAA